MKVSRILARKLSAVCMGVACLVFLSSCTGSRTNASIEAIERQQLDTILQVAQTSASAGELQVAQRIYHTAVQEFPDAFAPKIGLARLSMQQGDYLSAEQFFQEASELENLSHDEQAEAWLGLGRTNLNQGDQMLAQEYFLKAKEHARGMTLAYSLNGLAFVQKEQGNILLAQENFEKAVEVSNRYPIFVMNLIRALAEWDKKDEAGVVYRQYPAAYWPEAEQKALADLLRG